MHMLLEFKDVWMCMMWSLSSIIIGHALKLCGGCGGGGNWTEGTIVASDERVEFRNQVVEVGPAR